jgi:hypothetical protein
VPTRLTEAIGQNATGRAGTNNDVVVGHDETLRKMKESPDALIPAHRANGELTRVQATNGRLSTTGLVKRDA